MSDDQQSPASWWLRSARHRSTFAAGIGLGGGLAIAFGSRRVPAAPTAPPEPSGPPVSRSALTTLSVHDMTALLDARRYVLATLARRGVIDHDVDELDRKPLGSLE